MVRLPDFQDVGQAPGINTGTVVQPSRGGQIIGAAVANFGDTVVRVNDGIDRQKKEQTDSLELATANSAFTANRLQELDKYKLETNPDMGKWDTQWNENIRKHQEDAAAMISNPNLKQRFLATTQDDIMRGSLDLKGRKDDFTMSVKRGQALQGLEDNIQLAAKPGLSQIEIDKIFNQNRAMIDNWVATGVMTPERAVELRQKFVVQSSVNRFQNVVHDDPEQALKWVNGGGKGPTAVAANFESFRPEPYPDRGGPDGTTPKGLRIGYGSDTITLADGSVLPVKAGMTVTKADAQRDLDRRMGALQADVVKDIGPGAWGNLPPAAKAGVMSVVYNYTGMPDSIKGAVKSGDVKAIADAVRALSGQNGGINAKRRQQEAAIIEGGKGYDALDPPDYMKFIPPDDMLRFKTAAETLSNQRQAEADKVATITNAQAAADHALANPDRREAKAIVDKITDPVVRHAALSIMDSEYNRKAEIDKKERVDSLRTATQEVLKAIEEGNPVKALEAIPSGMLEEDKALLRTTIKEGRARVDDAATEEKLTALRMKDPNAFAKEDLTKYLGVLSVGTIDRFASEQAKMKDPQTSKDMNATVNASESIVKDNLRAIGIEETGANSTQSDIQYGMKIRKMVTVEMERLTAKLGRTPLLSEMQSTIDQTFKSFTKPGRFWGTTEGNIKDIVDAYDTAGIDLTKATENLIAKGYPVTPENLQKIMPYYQMEAK